MDTRKEATRFDLFVADAKRDMDKYRAELKGDGTFAYVDQVKALQKLASNMNGAMLIYLFGDQLGSHLADKFHNQARGDMMYFLRNLTSEYQFFILYSLKNDQYLFMHS